MPLSTRSKRRFGFGLAALAAVVAGSLLRLWLVVSFPYEAGDTPLYETLARNLLTHRSFALEVDGRLQPVDVRMPGYPAFLAFSHAFFGPGFRPVRFAQAGLDMLTCLATAVLAALLARGDRRRPAALAGLWLAALCPFTANYTCAILAETHGAFWTVLSFVLLLAATARCQGRPAVDRWAALAFLGAGAVAGVGCYFRPETPIVLMAGGLVLLFLWRRRRDWRRLVAAGLALGAGLALTLSPWALRNALVLGRFEVLPPPAANLPGEMSPAGFNKWTATWLTTDRQIYDFSFKIEEEPLSIDALPPSAYDSPEERRRVVELFARHNADLTLTPELDGAFAALARERTARHPLRTWLFVPLARCLTMWVSSRLELLPFSGELLPLRQAWSDDRYDVSVTVALFVLDLLYIALAVVGLARAWWRSGAVVLATYVVLRTALITQMPGPEPRYVVICFPLLAALAAQLWARPRPA